MKGNEFIKRVRKLAKERGLFFQLDSARGKGSHVTLYFGDKLTIVRNPKDELKTGPTMRCSNNLALIRKYFRR